MVQGFVWRLLQRLFLGIGSGNGWAMVWGLVPGMVRGFVWGMVQELAWGMVQ